MLRVKRMDPSYVYSFEFIKRLFICDRSITAVLDYFIRTGIWHQEFPNDSWFLHQNKITFLVGVIDTISILSLVTYSNSFLLSLSNCIPIDFGLRIDAHIASENQLRRRMAVRLVIRASNGVRYCGKVFIERIIVLGVDVDVFQVVNS